MVSWVGCSGTGKLMSPCLVADAFAGEAWCDNWVSGESSGTLVCEIFLCMVSSGTTVVV